MTAGHHWGVSAEERVIFSHSVEGMFIRGVGEAMTPALHDELKGLGIDLSKRLMPAYPLPVWNAAISAAAAQLFPDRPIEEAACKLGEQMISGYSETVVGKALLAMLRLIGPRRTLLRTRKSFRSGNNYCEVEVIELAPTDFTLTFNEPGVARWVLQGLVLAGIRFAGAKSPSVTVAKYDQETVTFHVTWES